jgi:hypothetical protein
VGPVTAEAWGLTVRHVDADVETYIDADVETYVDADVETYIDADVETYIDADVETIGSSLQRQHNRRGAISEFSKRWTACLSSLARGI